MEADCPGLRPNPLLWMKAAEIFFGVQCNQTLSASSLFFFAASSPYPAIINTYLIALLIARKRIGLSNALLYHPVTTTITDQTSISYVGWNIDRRSPLG